MDVLLGFDPEDRKLHAESHLFYHVPDPDKG